MRDHGAAGRSPVRQGKVAGALLGGLALAVVGGLAAVAVLPDIAGAKSTHHAITISKHAAATQYLGDDASFSTARTAYQTDFTAWLAAHKPSSETTSFVDPFVAACHTFEQELQSQKWPAADKSSIRRFAASLGVVATDVNSLPTVTLATGTAWGDKLTKDSATSLADAEKVRKELGLPAT